MRSPLLALALCVTSALSFVRPSAWHRTRVAPTALHESLWQSTVSSNPDPDEAVSELFDGLKATPGLLTFLFVGKPHGAAFESIVQKVHKKLGPKTRLLSLLAAGVVGGRVELDEPSKPSMSLLTGVLPEDADVELFDFNELKKPPPDPKSPYWSKLIGNQEHRSAILMVDPWSPLETILQGLSNNKAVVAGGISVPTGVGPSLGIDGEALPQGSAVGVCFRSGIGLQTIVAQGCRPVGRTYTVTACEQNCILELDSKPALQMLEEMATSAPIEEQRKISSSLVCGMASSGKEDYLIRQIMGFVPNKGGIAIGGSIKVGDSFRFHVRDGTAAQEDLRLMMKRAKTERLFDANVGHPVAALQISCVARGRGLFGTPNVDLESIQELLDGPVGGFFANGEIGPVGIGGFSSANEEAFLHGFTTVAALICDYSGVAKENVDDKSGMVDEPADTWG